MTKTANIYSLLIIITLTGCIISKKSTDTSFIRYISKDTIAVKDAAEFAVSVTFENVKREFNVPDVEDTRMRKKIAALGSSVYVYFKNSCNYEIADSNVTFKRITLFGVTEVIYDFATTPRLFGNNNDNSKDYYFVRLTDRIYYRRRQVPMM